MHDTWNQEKQFHITIAHPLNQDYYKVLEAATRVSAQQNPQMASSSSRPPPGVVSEFKCDKCQKTLRTKSGFQKHVCADSPKSVKINCEFCKQKFTTTSTLQMHIQKKHRDEVKEEGGGSGGSGDFRCSWCFQRFETQSAAEVHEKIHFAKDKQVFKCSTCFYKFSSQSRLDDHDKALCAYNSLLSQCVAQSKDDGPTDADNDFPGEGQESSAQLKPGPASGARKRPASSKTKAQLKPKAKATAIQDSEDSESEPEFHTRKCGKVSDKLP